MSIEGAIAIITASLALIGSIIVYASSAKKNDVEVLRSIIQELKEYVADLEADKEDLQAWVERLVCQVKEAGIEPAKFTKTQRRPKAGV